MYGDDKVLLKPLEPMLLVTAEHARNRLLTVFESTVRVLSRMSTIMLELTLLNTAPIDSKLRLLLYCTLDR